MDEFLIVLSAVIFVVGAGTVLLLFTTSSRGDARSSDSDCGPLVERTLQTGASGPLSSLGADVSGSRTR
ncbi:hypothetical protein QFZ21_004168 [Microbacterium sp. W4I20]|nr:hypothetical protein [Microbacterium sp. W4I20]